MHPTPQSLAVLNVTSTKSVSFLTPFIVVDINDPPLPKDSVAPQTGQLTKQDTLDIEVKAFKAF